ncbi:MAG: hypothetical protein D6795_16960, partial [Deltaproteobacteria bacterium]
IWDSLEACCQSIAADIKARGLRPDQALIRMDGAYGWNKKSHDHTRGRAGVSHALLGYQARVDDCRECAKKEVCLGCGARSCDNVDSGVGSPPISPDARRIHDFAGVLLGRS